MQADACAGFNRLYEADRKHGPVTEDASWASLPNTRVSFALGSPQMPHPIRIAQSWALVREVSDELPSRHAGDTTAKFNRCGDAMAW
jgi:hypothetical protein